jgi:hypothetical protein
MAITDLYVNNATDRAVVYPSWAVRLNDDTEVRELLFDEGGTGLERVGLLPNEKSQVSASFRPRKVSWSAGGSRLDYAQVDLVGNDSLINRLTQPSAFVKMCDVLLPSRVYLADDDDDLRDPETGKISAEAKAFRYGGNVRLIAGDYVVESESVNITESLSGQIAVSDTLFGRPLPGMQVLKYSSEVPAGHTVKLVECEEIVFNPEIDGVVKGNKSSIFDNLDHYWLDPLMAESQAALQYVKQAVSEWSLPEAVKRLCLVCNKPEAYVRNPIIDETDDLWASAPPLKNVALETGQYLPYYLDAILHPHGYNWCVDHQALVAVDSGDTYSYDKPIIRIFRKGWSPNPPKELNFQPPLTALDLSKSNVNEYQIDRSIADAYNGVRVIGGKILVELTIPLYPGWRESEDELTADQLSISTGSQYAGHKTAHRLWVANEWAGFSDVREDGWSALVPSFDDFFNYKMPDSTGAMLAIYGEKSSQIKKRVLGPPLTYQGTEYGRVRRDVLLEYSPDFGQTWIEVSSEIGSWAVLEDQIAIIFNDDKPPEVIMELFSGSLEMRVTGTIESDANIFNKFTEYSPNLDLSVVGRKRSLTVHKENEFRLWYVAGKNSPFDATIDALPMRSVLRNDPAGAETYDGRQSLVDFANTTLRNVRHAEYSANFTLPGWHTEYRIGDLISKINGREIGLNQSADPDDPRYMQITGIEWEQSDETGPSTRIIVDRGMNTAPRTRKPEYGPPPTPPVSDLIRSEVQDVLRKESEKMDASVTFSTAAMDRLRGVTR